jgi:hypothetical protein
MSPKRASKASRASALDSAIRRRVGKCVYLNGESRYVSQEFFQPKTWYTDGT